jgi:glycosyltransferase involved in cell wall biosynthesis
LKILFITWDGPQVTYLETLFLPIFSRLAAMGFHFHIMQFTWANAARVEQSRKACEAAGFSYEPVRIMRWPKALAALMTAVLSVRRLHAAIREHNIDILMPRSTLPSLTVLLRASSVKCRVVFDADGLPLDERVEFGGQSPSGLAHRFQRDIEAQMVRHANAVIVRTTKAADILLCRAGAGTDENKFHIVSNGRDSNFFKPLDHVNRSKQREHMGISVDCPLVVYAGSLGGKYRFPEMLQLFRFILALRNDARLLVLTAYTQYAEVEVSKYPELKMAVDIRTARPDEVPQYMGCADLGLALIQSSFSMQAVSAVKTGEYFLCGLPVVATTGIGDSSCIPESIGFLIDEINVSKLEAAANWFIHDVMPARNEYSYLCRKFGESNYSLEACVASYAKAFVSIV